jgi:hypothetical protein
MASHATTGWLTAALLCEHDYVSAVLLVARLHVDLQRVVSAACRLS